MKYVCATACRGRRPKINGAPPPPPPVKGSSSDNPRLGPSKCDVTQLITRILTSCYKTEQVLRGLINLLFFDCEAESRVHFRSCWFLWRAQAARRVWPQSCSSEVTTLSRVTRLGVCQWLLITIASLLVIFKRIQTHPCRHTCVCVM